MCIPLEFIKSVSYPKEMVHRQRVEIEDPVGEKPTIEREGKKWHGGRGQEKLEEDHPNFVV